MDPVQIRVATLNIRTGTALDGPHLWPRRKHSLLSAIRELDADLLGLQEVLGFQRRWLLRRLPDYRAFGSGRSRWRSGEASPVLVRSAAIRDEARENEAPANVALNIVAHRTRWFGETPDRPGTLIRGAKLPRIATTCTIELLGAGRRFDITSLHLDHRSEPRRTESAAQLLEWLDPSLPQIVVGDFNATADSPSLRLFLDHGFHPALDREAPGTFHGFTGQGRPGPIDHILVSEQFRTIEAQVVQRQDLHPLPTDHWPVVATVELR